MTVVANSARAGLVRYLQDGCWHSGEAIAHELGISRAAVWKHIHRLRAWGVEIQAVRGAGYRLTQPLELLDEARIRGHLGHAAADAISIKIFQALESTNTYLMSRPLRSGIDACLAEYQHTGRGSRGRRWVSPFAANIALSIGWRFAETPPGIGSLPLAVGLACAAFLRDLGAEGIFVKWPNDLVIAGRKLGGILVEHRGEASGAGQVVVGIGLNVHMSALQGDSIDQPWTDLVQALPGGASMPPSRNRVAAGLIDAMMGVRDGFQGEGFAPFLRRWLEFDAVRDCAVNVQAPTGVLEGTARGVDVDGALLLDTSSGRRRVFSGEVSLRLSRGAR